jgi:DNA-directed RNA polymerase specialized sigma24 family protein
VGTTKTARDNRARLAREEFDNLTRALPGLPVYQLTCKEALVVKLAVLDGWSHQQIANATGYDLSSIGFARKRGMMRLRLALSAEMSTSSVS